MLTEIERKAVKRVLVMAESQNSLSVLQWEESDFESFARDLSRISGLDVTSEDIRLTIDAVFSKTNVEIPQSVQESLPFYVQKGTWHEMIQGFSFDVNHPKKLQFSDVPNSFWKAVLYLFLLFVLIYFGLKLLKDVM